MSFNHFFGLCGDSALSVLHWQDTGINCDGVFVWHTAYFVKGIQECVFQIFSAVDGFMVVQRMNSFSKGKQLCSGLEKGEML